MEKPITRSEASKLNKAVETLRSFCESHTYCGECPFKKDGVVIYGTTCKFGSTYPELWDDFEIKETEDHE